MDDQSPNRSCYGQERNRLQGYERELLGVEQVMNAESTVTFKCEGCGARKPEAERYRPPVRLYGLFPAMLR